jgi:membrane-associated PAP2 superfamily phosphatase
LGVPVLWGLALFWVTAYSTVDMQVSRWFYDPRGFFPLGHTWFMEEAMHGYTKQPTRLLVLLLLALLVMSAYSPRVRPWRRRLVYTVLALSAGAGLVSVIKHQSNVYCPSDLLAFGGVHPHQWPFQVPRLQGVRPGECWPGGHASYGFALLPLYFALRDHHRRWAYGALAVAMLYGHALGAARVMQGAHFMTHQFWTALFCWATALGFYVGLLRRDLLPSARLRPRQAASRRFSPG